MNNRIFVAFTLDTSFYYKKIDTLAVNSEYNKFRSQYTSACEDFVKNGSEEQYLLAGYLDFDLAEEAAELMTLKGSELDEVLLSLYETDHIVITIQIPGEDVCQLFSEELEAFIKESLYEDDMTTQADIDSMLEDPWSVFESLPEEAKEDIYESTTASVLKEFPLRTV